MTEKTASKYLLNLEKHFANDSPVLLKAAKIFHSLDQIEYDLGLIEMDETTACKSSWWPIVSLIGGNSTAKSRFVNSYLGTQHHLTQKDWSEIPAFAKLGLTPEETIKTLEEVREELQELRSLFN